MAEFCVAVTDAVVCGDEVTFWDNDEWTLCEDGEFELPEFEYADVAEDDIVVE